MIRLKNTYCGERAAVIFGGPSLLARGFDFARLRDYVGRGVATTATYEARALGVHSAMGLMKAAKDAAARGRVHAWIGIGLGALEVLVGCGSAGFIGFAILSERRR